MVCSYYKVFAYDSKRNVLATIDVYSFDEAYYFIDKFREQYQKAVEFAIKYPDDEVAKKIFKEIAQGKWIEQPDPYGFFETIPVCSECGCTTKYREKYKYCPNCGAKMEDLINVSDDPSHPFADDVMMEQPELIRCKGCHYYEDGHCDMHHMGVSPDDYCSYAVGKYNI